ncbi:hypothetical protein [Croceibacterium aestuarii]|uniref:hypothetical protein n=1 Tax=Croceibacterium aestuarii TaxID=3064139 RepID=UPI00272E24CF|nr:hypothetical protein [Croceibacterium sp. D39]
MTRLIFAAAAALTLSACANSALTVEQPAASGFRTESVRIERDPQMAVSVDPENLAYTQSELEKAFFGGDDPLFDRGSGMTVRYRYVGFNEGSRLGRYLTAGLAGGSKVVLETEFIAPDGRVLGTVRGEGEVRAGFAGGSNKTGIDKAIKRIAEYAAVNFR